MSLYEKMKEAGATIENHCSDMHVPVNATTTRIIEDWCKENDFRIGHHAPQFTSQIDGSRWYDVAFQYEPYRNE